MTAPKSVDPAGFLGEQLGSASPDLLRDMVKTFADALMLAEGEAICGAPYGRERCGTARVDPSPPLRSCEASS
jgi:hypothetical protein